MAFKDMFNVKDKVFGKVKGWPAWPGMVTSIKDKNSINPKYVVQFYGTYAFALCLPNELFSYEENKLQFEKPKMQLSQFKRFKFMKALNEIENDFIMPIDGIKVSTTDNNMVTKPNLELKKKFNKLNEPVVEELDVPKNSMLISKKRKKSYVAPLTKMCKKPIINEKKDSENVEDILFKQPEVSTTNNNIETKLKSGVRKKFNQLSQSTKKELDKSKKSMHTSKKTKRSCIAKLKKVYTKPMVNKKKHAESVNIILSKRPVVILERLSFSSETNKHQNSMTSSVNVDTDKQNCCKNVLQLSSTTTEHDQIIKFDSVEKSNQDKKCMFENKKIIPSNSPQPQQDDDNSSIINLPSTSRPKLEQKQFIFGKTDQVEPKYSRLNKIVSFDLKNNGGNNETDNSCDNYCTNQENKVKLANHSRQSLRLKRKKQNPKNIISIEHKFNIYDTGKNYSESNSAGSSKSTMSPWPKKSTNQENDVNMNEYSRRRSKNKNENHNNIVSIEHTFNNNYLEKNCQNDYSDHKNNTDKTVLIKEDAFDSELYDAGSSKSIEFSLPKNNAKTGGKNQENKFNMNEQSLRLNKKKQNPKNTVSIEHIFNNNDSGRNCLSEYSNHDVNLDQNISSKGNIVDSKLCSAGSSKPTISSWPKIHTNTIDKTSKKLSMSKESLSESVNQLNLYQVSGQTKKNRIQISSQDVIVDDGSKMKMKKALSKKFDLYRKLPKLQELLNVMNYIYDIRSTLSIDNPNYKVVIESLLRIKECTLSAIMWKTNPDIVETILKVSHYTGNYQNVPRQKLKKHRKNASQIRCIAQEILVKIGTLFNVSNMQTFQIIFYSAVEDFKQRFKDLSADVIYSATSEDELISLL